MTYVVDSTISFGAGEVAEKKFPYWILLLGIPLIMIPLVKKKKSK